jgi:hypothetical protein
MPRWLMPALFALAALVGGAAWFYGYVIHVHAGACDAPSCPSESAVATGHTLLPVGAAVFGVSGAALIALLVRDYRRRQRGRPPRRKPSLRDW